MKNRGGENLRLLSKLAEKSSYEIKIGLKGSLKNRISS